MSRSRGCRPSLAFALVSAFISLDARALDAQCSMCRTLLGTPEGERMIDALRSGIWILLVAPLGAFAVVAVAAVRSRQRYLSRSLQGEADRGVDGNASPEFRTQRGISRWVGNISAE